MGARVEGFGREVDAADLKLGDVAFLTLGDRVLVCMRVGHDVGAPFDLMLTQLTGPPLGKALPRVREIGHADYVALEGEIVARPHNRDRVPLPGGIAAGCLVLDKAGGTFIRLEADGVDYYDISTGQHGRPGEDRAYYDDWDLVLVAADGERLIAHLAIPKRDGPGS
jgi:hypothetical protein